MKRFYYFGSIVLVIFFLIACVNTLQSYKPKNTDEATIKDLLNKWEHTYNTGDVPGNLALWNDNAKIKYGKFRKIATKEEYRNILPERMKAHQSVKLGPPTIRLSEKNAEVSVNMSIGSLKFPTIYHLIKENNTWSIMSWNY
jgi:hypothetical protein